MPVMIRPLETRDYTRVVEIENTIHHQPGSVEEFAYFIETWLAERPIIRLVAEVDGQVMGWAAANYGAAWLPEGDSECHVLVHPDARLQGIGGALWAALLPFLQANQPRRLRADVRDDLPAALAWSERRGFVQQHRIFDSVMDPTQFDETPFAGVVAQAEARGLRWVHFNDIQTPETERQLWAYATDLIMDVPDAADRRPSPYEDWRQWFLDSPSAWAAGTILAVTADGQWAGLTATQKSQQPEQASITITGVARAYRGMGLTLALKIVAIRWLAQQGITSLLTNNHSDNQRMLAVNGKLGYVAFPGFYELVAPYPAAERT